MGGLISGMSPKGYQISYSPPTIIRCCCFTWTPEIQPGVVEGVSKIITEPCDGGKGLWNAGSFFINPPGQREGA